MSSKIQFDKDNDNSSAENHDKWTDDDDDDDDNDNDHLMKINPLKLLGNEGVVKPLQFIRGHIQPPDDVMRAILIWNTSLQSTINVHSTPIIIFKIFPLIAITWVQSVRQGGRWCRSACWHPTYRGEVVGRNVEFW